MKQNLGEEERILSGDDVETAGHQVNAEFRSVDAKMLRLARL